MGRKKIKIRPIKDDRNRAVTFLKRKNGLFKKAFELAVLCRAEVAVIVFAGNKKLYEFASSDIKDVLYRYTQAPEPYEHRGPEDFQNKEEGDSDDSDDIGLDMAADYHRVMSHTPQPHGASQFLPHMTSHQRRTSNDSILSDRRQSMNQMGTPQLMPHRTPPHSRHPSLQHIGTPPQHFQVPMPPNHGSPQPATSAVRGAMMQHGMGQDNVGMSMGVTAPQPYGVNYNNPYGHQQQVYMPGHDNPPRRPSSTPNYQYAQSNPYQPSTPPLPPPSQQHPPPQPDPPTHIASQPEITEIKSKNRMKSIHTPVSFRASSLAAHFDNSRSQYDRPPPPAPPRSHSVDSGVAQQPQIIPNSVPLSLSPPPITGSTPGSTSNNNTGQRPKLSLHIPDDEDPTQQAEESVGSATPGTGSPELNRAERQDNNVKSEHSDGDGDAPHSQGEPFFLPPPNSASSLLPAGRLPGPGLGGFDNSNNSGGTPLSALPSRYAGDMLPSPSTFYPEFYGSLPSAGGSTLRSGGFNGLMNGTPVVARADEVNAGFGGFGGNGGSGEKRRSEEIQGTTVKRART